MERELHFDPLMLVVFGLSAEAAHRRAEPLGDLGGAALLALPLGLLFDHLDPLMLVVPGFAAETAHRRPQPLGRLGRAALGTLPFCCCHRVSPLCFLTLDINAERVFFVHIQIQTKDFGLFYTQTKGKIIIIQLL